MDYDRDTSHRQRPEPQEEATLALFATVLSFVGLNLMWVFFAGWLLFGMVPALLFALFLNHMITRIELSMQPTET
ncbi:histidinol phosphate aminotransferase [Pseudophaeobacter leonis]|uniref:histidinol phosphate aminotransferase n=1 Tax=Pseudophaeobacter leonis TaxID=1144477 RepID=UPI0009F3734E|nr:histidinol phosphate aminotransferase [Pseudophaeobacter leonis]